MATPCGNNINCGCQDTYLTSPAPCPTPADCPEAQPCSEVFDAECVKYTGDDIVCLQDIVVEQNTSVSDALNNIVDYFCNPPAPVSITANNGLTMSTPTNVRLGGLLVQNTTITTSNGTLPQDFNFKITGARASNVDSILLVENTGLGSAISATSTSNTAIQGFSPGQPGGYFISQTNTAVIASSNTFNVPALITVNVASLSNGKPTGLRLDTIVTLGLPTNGVGNKIQYSLSHVNGSGFAELIPSNEILSTFTNVLSASLTSDLIFRGRANGAITLSDLVNFKGDGEVQFYEYGVGNFVNTPTYMLGVDALGNIVEVAL
jgi:hypothetical protein